MPLTGEPSLQPHNRHLLKDRADLARELRGNLQGASKEEKAEFSDGGGGAEDNALEPG